MKLPGFLEKKIEKFRFSLLFVPEASGVAAESKKLSFNKAVVLLVLYTFLIGLMSSLTTFAFHAAYVKANEPQISAADKLRVLELDRRVGKLLNELEQLRIDNANLEHMIITADSTLKEKLPSGKKKKSTQGNMYQAFLNWINGAEETTYFLTPLTGYVSRKFNPEIGHFGVDIASRLDAPIKAAANGYVLLADFTVNEGYVLMIAHTNGYISVYKHCNALLKKERDIITQGEIIALAGSTGEKSSGVHLHFELWKDGRALDPQKYFVDTKGN